MGSPRGGSEWGGATTAASQLSVLIQPPSGRQEFVSVKELLVQNAELKGRGLMVSI